MTCGDILNVIVLNWRDSDNPLAGGAEVVVSNQCRGLARLGHTVTLFTSRFPGSEQVSDVDSYRVVRQGGRFTSFLAAVSKIKRSWDKLRPDALIENINGVPWFGPIWSEVPVLGCLYHRVGPFFFREVPPPIAMLGFAAEAAMPKVYRDTPMTCLGATTKREFVKMGFREEQLFELNPGVDHDLFRPGVASSKDEIFVLPGPLKRYKRPEIAVWALNEIRDEFPRVGLLLTGSARGETALVLARLISRLGLADRVRLAGYVSEQVKASLFQKCLAVIYCSTAEGWGLATLEAAACGTPAIVPDSTGLLDAVSPGRTGLFYRTGDVKSLAGAMRTLLRSPDLVRTLGENALEVSSTFTWERYSEKFEEILLDLLLTQRVGPMVGGSRSQ